jgi:hypothetical protein
MTTPRIYNPEALSVSPKTKEIPRFFEKQQIPDLENANPIPNLLFYEINPNFRGKSCNWKRRR